MSRRVEGSSYGQRVPPLTTVIKSILERYPDGGQILKEIIQNADDASATKVSFLLDSRGSPYGKSSLYNDELAKFQGPALYSFNNALFKEEDWEGLQSLMDSNKKEEPLKVGRFGIGFNSIYHVTDFPSVVSGQLLAFLDPHEKYFGKRETGQQFDLQKPLIRDYEDQFSPFEDVLDCKISSQFVNGTLFRFPLRTEASQLSKKPYTTDKVRHLFQSLKDEASLILLFLKNIEEINLYETDEHQREKLVFSVRLHDCCRKRVREQRQNLLIQVPNWQSGRQSVLQLDLKMAIEISDTATGTRQEQWITHNRIGDKEAKMRERALSLHLLPWVGFAAPLSVAGGKSIGSNGGRIFCFLPLPPDADAKTGYPVHIHGYFGLTDNRRGLKWPGPECQNDDMAEWNVDLMRFVGSQAYASILQTMTTLLPVSPDMISIFYQCWPNKKYVNKHWKDIIDKVYKLLLSESVFWAESDGGRWLSLNQAVLERISCENLSAETKTVVKKVLHLANEPVVSLPSHVDEYVRINASGTRLVSPTYLRAILKQNRKGSWNINNMSRAERIAMLEYIVIDNTFADFEGIALLPLADGSFTTFKAGKRCGLNDVVYVETQDNRMKLLPGKESRFLDPSINCLSRMAAEQNNYRCSPLQLVRLNPQTVVSLLWQIFPNEMLNLSDPVVWTPSRGNHPSKDWLENMWNWLKQKFAFNLTQLEGLPIIKCSLGQHAGLAKLRANTKTIRQQSSQIGMPLPQDVVSLLKKAGVVVLSEVPHYMTQHACFSTYVADASPEGVLKVLRNIGIQGSIAAVAASNIQDRRSLRVLLSSLRVNLSNDHEGKQFLKSLPIFQAIDQASFIDAQNKPFTAPRGFASQITLRIKNASFILSVEDNASNQLLKALNIPEMTMGQFLTKEIFPHLSCYTTQEITSLMCWALRRIDVFRNEEPSFCSHLSSLNFVDAGHGRLSRPQDLFDPRNELNKRLLEGEESKFPVGEFAKDDILVPLSNHLGLKGTLDHDDVVGLARRLDSFKIDQRRRKGMALLEFLEKSPSLLTRNVNVGGRYQMLQDFLRCVAWVPYAVSPPLLYPKCMPWKSAGNGLLRPQEVVVQEYGVVVGSVVSVLHREPTCSIKSFFGWDHAPDASKVFEQLRIACNEIDVESIQVNERVQFWRMLKTIYETMAANDYCHNLFQADFAWIWNGQGFSSPSKIAFRRQTNFDLEPYLYTIPKEMQEGDLRGFFPKFGVKACFTDEDLLDVLLDVKTKHDNAKLDRDVIAKDKQLALDILHWIVRQGSLNPELRDKVYVPVMKDPGILNLVPLTECTFCDADWLRGNFLELQMLPELSEFSLIDESISNKTASHLGVPPMSRCVTAPETLGFEQAGPYEPITRRLKNILDEYKEGAGVFKELVQNADDAGATEVKFLVDWRQHPVKKLLAEGMKESQGPALLAYNNAVFTEEDFENINKLAGATKKEDLDKIGRFGLGFNSVYHFTDTPSFVSSNYAVFFDPDTKHLGNFITNPSHPGIKVNLAVNRNTLLCYPDQFKPYEGVFECNVKGDTPFNFDGTLFRFPFRRGPSDICDKQYNERDVKELLESFKRSALSLLLNTQNVQHVSVWELDPRAKQPSDVRLLTNVERNILSDSGGSAMTTFLHDCAIWSSNRETPLIQDVPQRTKIISITHTTTEEEQKARTEYWLQCDRMGDAESLEMATSEEGRQKGLLSCAGVAVNLNKSRGTWKIKHTDGEAFCFLPLSIPTGLPVHVNGYFAVTSNRRGIWEQTAAESQHFQPVEARWNKVLMKDGIAQAYLELLKETKRMAREGNLQEYNFCSLWPNPNRLQSQAWKSLIVGVYTLIATSSIPLLKSGENWYSVEDCVFPDDDMHRIPESLQILQELQYKIVDLPHFARKGFSMAECGEQIESQTMSEKKFLEDVFFPNIIAINGELRNKVVCYLIDECLASSDGPKKAFFQELLSSNACIPCSADQQVLARPKDLIHPHGDAASLYSPCDNKMPVGDCFLEPKRLLELQNCGMINNTLTWDQIWDRAQSVQSLKYDNALRRVSNLVKYLNNYITDMPSADDDISQFLTTLPIFPVMPKPKSHCFPWEGERNGPKAMSSSNKLFAKEHSKIIGSLKPILDESEETGCGELKPKVRELFQISDHQPVVKEALTQLQIVCEHFQEMKNCIPLQDVTTGICNEIYAFLQSHISNEEDMELMNFTLQESAWLFMEDRFVKSNQVAFEWDGYGEPYLYRVPKFLAVHYRELLEEVGIKRTFNIQDFLLALKEMKTEKEEKGLNDSEFKVSKEFLDELNNLLDEIPEWAVGWTPMPDQDRILRQTQDLVINDAPWILMDQDVKYVHKDISINLAHTLGARDIRSKNLETISRSIGQPFGQKELLTDRLANILKSYPCDFGILKELLQNADDAKATEIHFVYDPRQHGKERLFKDSWKELQGPALCVYNNRPFTEKDLEGIQRLGIGSKADSPEKTGQYGIGFNAVYHLTDCPSFITDGNTLCILDPHARYAPGATKDNPGRLIGPFDESGNFQENYRDIFPGYLGDNFDLKGSTMFRFPLRNEEMASKSDISQEDALLKIKFLLKDFEAEAKETLLFLNYVKKISISKIEDDELKLIYEVSADLTEEDENKRRALAAHVKNSKHLPTSEIERFGIFYPITLKDSSEQKWLVYQTIGVSSQERSVDIPDGKQHGLLPRAGVAAKVTSKPDLRQGVSSYPERRKALCFLPLPVTTGLPLHVNGHFTLDSGRRHLWQDDDKSQVRSKWNQFMKTEVIADAYSSLLVEARRHIPYVKQEEQFYFSHGYEGNYGLQWYQGLFPSQEDSESQWEVLVVAVLNKITESDKNVLPLLQKVKTEQGFKHVCSWLSPSEGFFPSLDCDRTLSNILRNVGFNLVFLPHRIYENFKKAKTQVKEVAPEAVLKFLSSHKPILEQLPCPIGDSSMESAADIIYLIDYCMKSPSFVKNLDGVPLLLTRDGILRLFSKKHPVYVSKFSPLVQSSAHHERFAGREIVTVLQLICKELFLQSPPVVLPLNLCNLVTFFPFIFQEQKVWSQTSVSVSWKPGGEDREIKKWLTNLWFFISKEHKANPSDRFLEPLKAWPVIPTTSGYLLPVSLSKTVLDLTESDSWSKNQICVVHALRKLLCPEVDIELINSKGASVSGVVKTYLAYPNSVNDVITVLDSLMEREHDISGRIDAYTANLLLQFLKEDPETLQSNARNVPVLRKLPFYKTIDGQLIKLEGASSVCKVSPGIPLEGSSVWMEGTRHIFLEPCQSLDVLHKMLGVELKSHVSCYIDFIFPKFSLLQESTRLTHLLYIRDTLLHNIKGDEVARLESALVKLKFIPNVDSGDLHAASYYYDPRKPVLKAMLSKGKFPGKPFCKSEWAEFLCRIGLQTTFTKDQVLAFAREIEKEAEQKVTDALLEKSKALTRYLLQKESFHEANFLAKVSTVKFVSAHKAESKFDSLVKQHLFEGKALAPLISFRNALPNKYEILVWGSAALLSDWAWPSELHTRRSLGILEKPTLQQVKNHVQRLCSRFNSKDIDLNVSVRKLLLQIMSETYFFLTQSLPDSNVHQFFHGMPLVLVEDGRVFIRCEQLAFEMQIYEEQPPYLYKVPRQFGQFESLFKHLGAFEKPCPSQYAHILQILWKDSKGEEVHQEEMRHVKNAVRGLFKTLKRLHKNDERQKTTKCLNSLKDIVTLYLPTEKKHLKPSNQLYYVNPHLLSRIDKAEFTYDVLYDLMDCGLLNDHAEDLLGFLPPHLQVTPLEKVLIEELHADCFDRKCKMDESGKCSHANRLRSLLDSHHLIDGIIRILKFQNHSMKVDDELRTKVESLRTMFIVVCFESLETVLKNDKDEEARGSKVSKRYFAKEDGKKKCIFIQHGVRSIYSHVSYEFSLAVNKHIGNAVNEEHFAHLESIIRNGMIPGPTEIHSTLDNRGIEPDKEELTNSDSETSVLGSPIPEELHYLLVQFQDILFRPEEIVGYEKEDNSEKEQGEYCYARIVRETSAPNLGGRTKKQKRDPTTGKRKTHNSFLRRYLIDIGTGQNIEVVSLDLYKFKRPEELTDSNENTTDDVSDSQTVVPYDGEEQSTGANATTKNSRPDLPSTWEKAKKEVDKALADIMKLPKEQRKKAVKRLYLRWHPDKNPDMEELATEVMKYIQNEFQRLSEGRARDANQKDYDAEEWETSFRKWGQRARRQRASYDNYRRSNPGFTRNFSSAGGYRNNASGQSYYGFGPSGSSASSAPFGQRRNSYHAPDSKLARIWLIQSRSDLESVKQLFSAKTPGGFYWLICFQCNQVVEKALKAALYSVSGISNSQLESHDLTSLAYDLRRLPRAPDVIHSVGKLWSYHDATRYPHKHQPAKPPKEVYTFQQAQEAYDIAKSVLKTLEEFIGILHL